MKIISTTVSRTATPTSMVKQLPISSSALSRLPSPILIEASGAPPYPTSAANAEMTMMIGNASPTPVSATVPFPGIRPMYIRSTTL